METAPSRRLDQTCSGCGRWPLGHEPALPSVSHPPISPPRASRAAQVQIERQQEGAMRSFAHALRTEEEEEAAGDLTVMKPSGAVQVVETEVASPARRPTETGPKPTWLAQARRIFLDSSASQPAVEALKEGERLLGRSQIQIVKRRDLEGEGARMGEERAFSATMHEDWMVLLEEEIWALRAERMNLQNEMLMQGTAQRQQRQSGQRSQGGATAPHPSRSRGGEVPVQGRDTEAATQALHATSSADGLPPLKGAFTAARPRSHLGPAVTTGMNPQAPAPRHAAPHHRRRSTVGSLSDLEGAQEDVQELGAASGGVWAAMAAAEAATTGGKRMVRVWEGMKRMMPNASAPHSPHALAHIPAPLPDSRSKQHFPQSAAQGASAEQPRVLEGRELVRLLASGQVDPKMRGRAWVAAATPDDPEEDAANRSKYFQLLDRPSPCAREIERDVNRTFPSHCMFKEEKGAGQKALFNVIKAYSILDKEVGYCQGMGFIAATLLMQMGEEDAFVCLIHLMLKCGLRAVFLPDMVQLQKKMHQLGQLLAEGLDRQLYDHFQDKDIKPIMFAADWFLTLFARTMPNSLVARVFDIILVEKTTAIIFKLAMVLLQVSRRQLHNCPEMEYCMYFLRYELPSQLKSRPDADLEELICKARRVSLPFERFLQMEAEYEFLAGEARASAREMEAVAAANEAAAVAWERNRQEMESALHFAQETAREGKALRALLRGQVERLRELAARDASLNEQGASHSPSFVPAENGAEATPVQLGASQEEECCHRTAVDSSPPRTQCHEEGVPTLAAMGTRVESDCGARETSGQPGTACSAAEGPAGRGELGGEGLLGMPGSGGGATAGMPRAQRAETVGSTKIEAQVRSMYSSWKQRRRVTCRADDTLQGLQALEDLQQRMLELRTSLHEAQTALATAQERQDATAATTGGADALQQQEAMSPPGPRHQPGRDGCTPGSGAGNKSQTAEVPRQPVATSSAALGAILGQGAERPCRRRILSAKAWDPPPEDKATWGAEQQRETAVITESDAL